ncbi:unnamed protein product [Brugia timori]|uniref:MDMPI_C domain-containing protein n=1 Tax=Brugia timori TaxID=42155 RepID=A0A0R3QHK3_9BILA|nr:unnamed protein product [Brugia timori]
MPVEGERPAVGVAAACAVAAARRTGILAGRRDRHGARLGVPADAGEVVCERGWDCLGWREDARTIRVTAHGDATAHEQYSWVGMLVPLEEICRGEITARGPAGLPQGQARG